ncbi:MAG TPA: hypothetical protein VIL63_11730 [Terriglobales bacterium]
MNRSAMNGAVRLRHWAVVFGVSLALPLLCLAAKEFSMPATKPAFSYPAHDHHGTENVTVALDPYDTATKSDIFIVKYREQGLLPILLVITNDSEQPIQLSEIKAELVTADRSKLSPQTEDDIYRRISHPKASGTRYPLPFPQKKVKGEVSSKQLDEIRSAQFKAKAVEPRSSQAGFLFFDVSDLSNPLAGARFYLTGVRDSSGHELMYFEVPLDKYPEAARQR